MMTFILQLGGAIVAYGLASRLTNFVYRKLANRHFLFWSHATASLASFVLAGFGAADGGAFAFQFASIYAVAALVFVGVDYWWSVMESGPNE